MVRDAVRETREGAVCEGPQGQWEDFDSEVEPQGGFQAGEGPDLALVFTEALRLHHVGVGNRLYEVGGSRQTRG